MEQQQTFQCCKCKAQFQNNEVEFDPIPDNLSFSAPGFDMKASEEKGIPKCPKCGEQHFFGFDVIDIAF